MADGGGAAVHMGLTAGAPGREAPAEFHMSWFLPRPGLMTYISNNPSPSKSTHEAPYASVEPLPVWEPMPGGCAALTTAAPAPPTDVSGVAAAEGTSTVTSSNRCDHSAPKQGVGSPSHEAVSTSDVLHFPVSVAGTVMRRDRVLMGYAVKMPAPQVEEQVPHPEQTP